MPNDDLLPSKLQHPNAGRPVTGDEGRVLSLNRESAMLPVVVLLQLPPALKGRRYPEVLGTLCSGQNLGTIIEEIARAAYRQINDQPLNARLVADVTAAIEASMPRAGEGSVSLTRP